MQRQRENGKARQKRGLQEIGNGEACEIPAGGSGEKQRQRDQNESFGKHGGNLETNGRLF